MVPLMSPSREKMLAIGVVACSAVSRAGLRSGLVLVPLPAGGPECIGRIEREGVCKPKAVYVPRLKFRTATYQTTVTKAHLFLGSADHCLQ